MEWKSWPVLCTFCPGKAVPACCVNQDLAMIFKMSTDATPLPGKDAFFRYITVPEEAKRWGLHVTDLGYTKVPSGVPYPPFKHPESYTLQQETGRVLPEYQVIYITRGGGTFWSESSGEITIKAGSVFFLFPGIRHRYRPNSQTGWDEQGVGFTGDHADRLMQTFFDPVQPVCHSFNWRIRPRFRTPASLLTQVAHAADRINLIWRVGDRLKS